MTWQNSRASALADKTKSTSINTGINLVAGEAQFWSVSFDNTSATTPTVTSIPKAPTETAQWIKLASYDSSDPGAGGGVRTEIWGIMPTVSYQDYSASANIVLSEAVAAKVAGYSAWVGGGSSLVVRGSGGTSSSAPIVTTVTTLTGVTPNPGDLVLVAKASEGTTYPQYDTGSWTGYGSGTTGNASLSNVQATSEGIVSSGGDLTINLSNTADQGICCVVLAAGPPAPVVNFGGSGTLEAHKTEYPDLIRNSGPRVYLRLNDAFDPYDTGRRLWFHDSSPDNRNSQMMVNSAGQTTANMANAAWDSTTAGDYQAWDTMLTRIENLFVPGLRAGTDVALRPTGLTSIQQGDPTCSFLGGGTYYPYEGGARWMTLSLIARLDPAAFPGGSGGGWWAQHGNQVQRWGLMLNYDGTLRGHFYINLAAAPNATGDTVDFTTTMKLSPDTTYHIALSWDGTLGHIYVNGTEVATGTSTTGQSGELMWTSGSYDRDPNNPVWGNQAWYLSGISGVQQDFAFWDKALSAQEIADQAANALKGIAGLAQFASRGRLRACASYSREVLGSRPDGYWRLGELPGATTMVDSSGNGNHGTYMNNPRLGQPGLLADKSASSMVPSPNGTEHAGGQVTMPNPTEYTYEVILHQDFYNSFTALVFADANGQQWRLSADKTPSQTANLPKSFNCWQGYSSGASTPTVYSGENWIAAGARPDEVAHVAYVCRYSDAYSDCSAYVNGVLTDRWLRMPKAYAQFDTVYRGSSPMTLTIGVDANVATNRFQQADGDLRQPIQEVAFYSRALPQPEIANHAAAMLVAGSTPKASLSGAGSLTALGKLVMVGTVPVAGSGLLEAAAGIAYFASPQLAASGTLTAAARVRFTDTAAITGLSLLSTMTFILARAVIDGAGEGQLTSNGFMPIAQATSPVPHRRFWGQGT